MEEALGPTIQVVQVWAHREAISGSDLLCTALMWLGCSCPRCRSICGTIYRPYVRGFLTVLSRWPESCLWLLCIPRSAPKSLRRATFPPLPTIGLHLSGGVEQGQVTWLTATWVHLTWRQLCMSLLSEVDPPPCHFMVN